MIIGQGLLAKAFEKSFSTDPSVLVFASGVSDSTASDAEAFDREHALLAQAMESSSGRFVYFSSCAVGDESAAVTPYLRHKRRMEEVILSREGTLIFRLPQVVGKTGNPSTLTNFICRHILEGRRFTVWTRAERNLIDVEDVARIATRLIESPVATERVISIATPHSIRMPEIVDTFERVLSRHALFDRVEKGDPLRIRSELAGSVAKELGIEFDSGYAERLIRKYYGQHALR